MSLSQALKEASLVQRLWERGWTLRRISRELSIPLSTITHKRLLLRLSPSVREAAERLGLSWRKAFPLYRLSIAEQERALELLLERLKSKGRLSRSDVEAVVRELSSPGRTRLMAARGALRRIGSPHELAAWLAVLLLLGYSVDSRALKRLGLEAEPRAVRRVLKSLELAGLARRVERRYELSHEARQEVARLATPDVMARLLLDLAGGRRLPLVLNALRFWSKTAREAII
jgi:hypothetical protein